MPKKKRGVSLVGLIFVFIAFIVMAISIQNLNTTDISLVMNLTDENSISETELNNKEVSATTNNIVDHYYYDQIGEGAQIMYNTIMENIKDYQQYLRGYDYTGKIPVIIDFYATWCGPCQGMAPLLKRLAQDYEGRVKVLKVDVDKNQALAIAAHIQSIPTLFFITKDGDIERQVDALPYQELTRLAERIME
jgi:thioredoxin 1